MPLTAWATSSTLETVRLGKESDAVRLVFELDKATQYRFFHLSKPDRFVVDLINTRQHHKLPTFDFSVTPIKSIRSGVRKGYDLRLVFDLSRSAKAKVFALKPQGRRGHRVVIEMDRGKEYARAKRSPVVASVAKKKPNTKKSIASTTTKKPVRAVRREATLSRSLRDIIVAIDAGHGGNDPGAHGRNGTYEKDVVLAIARRLEKLIKREPGMRPVMIRDGDQYIDLRRRIKRAHEFKADLFVSIHADAFDDPRVRGASVYALSKNGATTEAAARLANRENAADLIGGVSLDDKDDLLASVLLDLSQNATMEASLDIAKNVLKGLKQVGSLHKSRVEQAGFAVLKSPDIPSILVETAFISNPKDERRLRSHKGQQQMAEAIMYGVRGYFVSNPPPGTRLAVQKHTIKRGETLSGIANRYQVSTSQLRLANYLAGDRIKIGQVLQIPRGET